MCDTQEQILNLLKAEIGDSAIIIISSSDIDQIPESDWEAIVKIGALLIIALFGHYAGNNLGVLTVNGYSDSEAIPLLKNYKIFITARHRDIYSGIF